MNTESSVESPVASKKRKETIDLVNGSKRAKSWSSEEEEILFDCVKKYHNRWDQIESKK